MGEELAIFFPNLNDDLKRAGMKSSNKEYISTCIMTSFLVLLAEIPIFSFIFGIIFEGIILSLVTALTVSILFALLIFYLFTKYPRTVIGDRSKKIDPYLPFASLFLSTIAGTRLPLDRIFKIFGRYSRYGQITEQVQMINNDIQVFGLDVNTALERAIDRTPSKKMKEMLWGILSTSVAGGDVAIYLRETTKTLMDQYRYTINQYSKKLALFIEIYLTAIVLGAIFFVILTSIFSGISGASTNIILLQSIIIFIFLPLLSVVFIIMVKMSSPVGE